MKTIIMLIIVIVCSTSIADAMYFSKSGWFLHMWVPDNFEYVPSKTKIGLGNYTDWNNSAISITAIDKPELRTTKTLSQPDIIDILNKTVKEAKESNSYLKYSKMIDTDNGHNGFIAEFTGARNHVVYFVAMHGQQYYIIFGDINGGVYDRESIMRSINSIYCSYE